MPITIVYAGSEFSNFRLHALTFLYTSNTKTVTMEKCKCNIRW